MTLPPMTRQEVPPLLPLSRAVLDALWDRVGHITLQSFSNAVHHFRRLTNPQAALFFRANDGRIALPASATMSH